ncbi:MAG: septum formation protein Maf [Spirochaetaceae bacterium]|nr:septum formation protein Maf [Spirochaetaceae bacterium]
MEPIILASSSQRRQEIFRQLGIPYMVVMPEIKEEYPTDLEFEKIPEYLASQKIKAAMKMLPQGQNVPWIFAADTLIFKGDKVYGKPETKEQAVEFLKELQDGTHTVITAIALFNGKINYLSTRTSINKVTFTPISDKEIEWYIETGEWHGVAGAYRIQGMASCFISHIEGTQSSIIGLPIFEFYDILKEQGYSLID